jgi:ABC-2 type transport system permease protein
MSMRNALVVARRELLERVRSKWFVVMTLLGPVFMVALVVVPAVIASRGATGTRVEILDHTGAIGGPLKTELEELAWVPVIVPAETLEQTELDRIRDDQINGYIVIPKDALDDGLIRYRGDNGSSQALRMLLQLKLNTVVQQQRGLRAGLTEKQLERVLAKANFEPELNTGEAKGSSGTAAYVIAYILAFILYMVITLYGVAVMRSVVQEKTSRVMELMVAAVKPRDLMAGKILGVGAAGLIQVTVWLTIGAITLAYRSELLGLFGMSGGGDELPSLAFTEIAVVLAFFVLGFFFYSSMYAAVGAMVSSEQDTQQVQMPVTLLLVIGVTCLQVIANDPRGGAAQTMSMVPLWSSMLMPMRFVLGGATLGEVALSLAILLVSTVLIVAAAAKIYRIGVLMYGKRPSLRELVRWLRY